MLVYRPQQQLQAGSLARQLLQRLPPLQEGPPVHKVERHLPSAGALLRALPMGQRQCLARP